ncbi:hypothetical protein ACJIZ3_018122 [Penstemon smallii]|uniref:Uncharacterized protein n=1 Tax=Penstemon smallii TaxID=265156 RepID=A0ABD3SXY4_9LAMI
MRDQGRLKSTPDVKRNPRKVVKKSLDPEFTAVLEDDSEVKQSPKEVPNDNPFSESAENINAWVNPVGSPSSVTITTSDLASPSSTITCDKHVGVDASDSKCEILEIDSFKKIECIEAELVIKHLGEARIQVMKSQGLGHSRKLLDALINVIIEEAYNGLYEEKEWLDKIISSKTNLVFLGFMLGMVVIFVVLFFNMGSKGLLNGPPPT